MSRHLHRCVVVGLIVFGLGAVVRRARERADLMQAQRDVADRRAADIAWKERERIARELHDVVAHGMSVVVLQARGGRRMLDAEPIRAARAFDDIERVASSCLDEMRRLVGILRAREPGTAPLAPQPKLAEVGALVEQARASGAVVDLVVTGQQRELTPALELAGYRIAQEALTNALKHAPGSTTRVQIRYDPERLEISVEDDGPGAAPAGTDGHGLVGMRERAELYGGTFQAGSEPGSGFHVNATLPPNGSEPMTIRVVADDERLIRAGYRMILDTEPDLEVVGEAEDGVVAVELARRLAPDVVLMDVRMPRMDGIAATRALSRWAPAPAVLVVTTFDLDEYVYESLRAVARLQRRDSAGRLRLCRGVQPDRGGAEVAPDGRGRHPHRTAGVRPGEAGLWEGAPQAERITARER